MNFSNFNMCVTETFLSTWSSRFNQVKAHPLSFSSGKELRSRIDLLPKAPEWESQEVVVEGGTTKRKIIFYFRKGLPCFKFLVGTPVFREHSELVAYRAFSDEAKEKLVYGSGMGSQWAWEMQVRFFASLLFLCC